MKNKKVFLNGKEITKFVKEIEITNSLEVLSGRLSGRFVSEYTIRYMNGAVFHTGDNDKIEIINITPKLLSPEYKVGDYAVVDHSDGSKLFYKIDFVCLDNGKYSYNGSIKENKMRKPTKEELKLYFR